MFNPQRFSGELIRQIDQRRQFLASFGTASDKCWEILLRIYTYRRSVPCSVSEIAQSLNLPSNVALRYFDLLQQQGYLRQHLTNGIDMIEIPHPARLQLEELLKKMAHSDSSDGC